MKKIIAATLLVIFLFNIGGQLVLHQYFAYLSDKFFSEQTSKGLYNVNDLTEVVIPVNMPNIQDWTEYENIAGQIQFENNSYNYVKMKITRKAMYLMVVPNYNTTHLSGQNIIGAKNLKGLPVPKKEHTPFGKIILLSQFSFSSTHFKFNAPFKPAALMVLQPFQQLFCHFPAIPDQPPRSLC